MQHGIISFQAQVVVDNEHLKLALSSKYVYIYKLCIMIEMLNSSLWFHTVGR